MRTRTRVQRQRRQRQLRQCQLRQRQQMFGARFAQEQMDQVGGTL